MTGIVKADILDALRNIDFLARSRELSERYSNRYKDMTSIDYGKIKEIIHRLGYSSGRIGKYFYLKNQIVGSVSFDVLLNFRSAILEVSWIVYDEGEEIYGAPWTNIENDLSDGSNKTKTRPSFGSYEELEEILAIVLRMFEDFKEVLLAKEGINCHEN